MITKNYKKLLATMLTYRTDANVKIVNASGADIKMSGWQTDAGDISSSIGYTLAYPKSNSAFNQYGVYFGTGTTASEDDYKLSGTAITGISISTVCSAESDENGLTSKAIYTITNGNSQSITIGEVGCFIGAFGNSSSSVYIFLADHTILDAPVTIPAGGIGQVTYTIRQEW